MKSEIVSQFLKDHGFLEKEYLRTWSSCNDQGEREEKSRNILPFSSVFIDSNENEIYIIEEKSSHFIEEEISKMENDILAFIQFLSNKQSIKYNINLVLLCPLNATDKMEEITNLLSFERSKYTCRKIILNTANENFDQELAILPSFPININHTFSEDKVGELENRLKEIVDERIYQELVRETDDINLEELRNHLVIEDDDQSE
ncbi:ABC-three component system middle component 1 [Mesobacillus zeae]|uniref:ABC-three component system middle component 1 n=1 Tax=Mesobacillus zeae TaxID=1917180 RepID=UPI0030098C1E